MRTTGLYILFVLIIITGCYRDDYDADTAPWLKEPLFSTEEKKEAYIDSLKAMREFRDRWMAEHPDSPLLPGDRADFTGLNYYPVDPDLVFRVPLHKYENPEKIIIATTTGVDREAKRYGYFELLLEEGRIRLHAYRFLSSVDENSLFVPFRDATSGVETYEGGRYLDLRKEPSGALIVDFNLAYNPFCVYDEIYSCPLPPLENHIDLPIGGGEKKFYIGDL